jgi:hypothetical protein
MKLIAVAVTAAVGCVPACTPEVPQEVIRVGWSETVPNLSGAERLDVFYDASNMGADWGGDASVEAAHEACLHMGGQPNWLNPDPYDGEYRLVCVGVDY